VKRPPVGPLSPSPDDLVGERISMPCFGGEMQKLITCWDGIDVCFDYQAKAALKFGTLM
jgi:hypothetical protein